LHRLSGALTDNTDASSSSCQFDGTRTVKTFYVSQTRVNGALGQKSAARQTSIFTCACLRNHARASRERPVDNIFEVSVICEPVGKEDLCLRTRETAISIIIVTPEALRTCHHGFAGGRFTPPPGILQQVHRSGMGASIAGQGGWPSLANAERRTLLQRRCP